MGVVSVIISVVNESAVPISGVFVEVYDALGSTLLGTQTTNGSGQATFSLNGDETGIYYNLRVYRTTPGSLFAHPLFYVDRRSIQVYDPLPSGYSNNFTFTCNSGALSQSTDPNYCRMNALFLRQDGRPIQAYWFSVRPRSIPSTLHQPVTGGLSGAIIVADRTDLRTDEEGKVVFDVVREGKYTVVLPDYCDEELVLWAPDASCADLGDFIFLYPKEVEYDTNNVSVAVGSDVLVEVTSFTMSDGREESWEEVEYLPSEYLDISVTAGASKVQATWSGNTAISILGVQAGSATIILVPKPYNDVNLHVRLPQAALTQTPISVTVT